MTKKPTSDDENNLRFWLVECKRLTNELKSKGENGERDEVLASQLNEVILRIHLALQGM